MEYQNRSRNQHCLFILLKRVVMMYLKNRLSKKVIDTSMVFALLLLSVFNTSVFLVATEVQAEQFITIDSPIQDEIIYNTTEVSVNGLVNSAEVTSDLSLFMHPIIDGVVGEKSLVATIPVSGDSWSTTLVDMTDGEYRLIAEVTDSQTVIQTSNTVDFQLQTDTIAPDVSITTPVEGEYTKSPVITGQTEPGLAVKLFLNTISYDTISDSNGVWTYDFTGNITDGAYSVYAEAIDESGNIGQSTIVNFKFDQTRPFISADTSPRHNMTRVALDTLIQAKMIDNELISLPEILSDSLIVYKKGTAGNEQVSGTISYDETTNLLTFTASATLAANTKYYVFTNPLLKDKAGNSIHPRNWSFTTVQLTSTENPHGNYTDNVNTCQTCHKTHAASEPILKEPNTELEQTMTDKATTSYCMACHDGTVTSAPEHFGEASTHDFQLVTNDGTVKSQSCGSCHNPHIGWGEHNPNLFQDHFTFDHTNTTGVEPFDADSEEQLCESCHYFDSLSKKMNERVQHKYYSFTNWNSSQAELNGQTTFGSEPDYGLCLRCHNSSYEQDYQNIVDIETYYTNTTSGHFITNDRVKDGSLLDGNIPCADCHNSHGSTNVKTLKSELGHNNRTTFTQTTETWTASEERAFCLTCHNNSTELYSITVSLNQTNGLGEAITGHSPDSTESCASCHGGTSATFIEAAHGPSR